jgi:uncharacterized protein (DUF433 family)
MMADELIERYIQLGPEYSEVADAVVTEYWIPVWALIGHLHALDGNVLQTAREYDIPIELVRAANAFYLRHRDAIDARLALNAA